MFCTACGTATAPSSGSSAPLGLWIPPANQPLTVVTDFLQEVASVSLKEITLVSGERAVEILKRPVFLLLSLVAIVPLAIQSLESAHSILYGLAIWSGLLWALLMYRLFARPAGLPRRKR